MNDLLDADGEPIQKPTQRKFGQFVVPPDAHIKGFGGLTGDLGWHETPEGYEKEYARVRCVAGSAVLSSSYSLSNE